MKEFSEFKDPDSRWSWAVWMTATVICPTGVAQAWFVSGARDRNQKVGTGIGVSLLMLLFGLACWYS